MTSAKNVSSAFPYESHFVEVYGSNMHYIEQGKGDPFLFLHGNPTSSYLWRNVIPHLSSLGRCIAPDLIGMGKSDSPEIEYRFVDHARYLERFIETLGLEHITLVIHDWGSALGFDYACQHETNVWGIAFMEAILMPTPAWTDLSDDMRQFQQMLHSTDLGWELAVNQNIFMERILPNEVMRGLDAEALQHYRAPYLDPARRKPLWRWPNELPIAGEPVDVVARVSAYNQWLQQTELPKLLLTASPGRIIGREQIDWCQSHLKHLTIVDTGAGLHFLQEENPDEVGTEIARWVQSVVAAP